MAKLTRAEIDQRMKTVRGWTLEGDAIKKQYTFAGFPEAVAFVDRLAPEEFRFITMRARVAAVNGAFSRTSDHRGGTQIDVDVPL